MQHDSTDDARTHEGGDRGDGQSDLLGVNRADIAERRHAEAHCDTADDRERRNAPYGEQVERHLFGRRGVGFVRQRYRHNRQRQRHGDEREDRRPLYADHWDDVLRQCHRTKIDETINGERARPVGIRHLRVDPAFDGGEQTGDRNADEEAHRKPEERIGDEDHGDGRRRCDGRHGGKDANMANFSQQSGHVDTADSETEAITGADEADGAGGKAFRQSAQGNERSLQAVSTDKNTRRQKKRNEGSDLAHAAYIACLE